MRMQKDLRCLKTASAGQKKNGRSSRRPVRSIVAGSTRRSPGVTSKGDYVKEKTKGDARVFTEETHVAKQDNNIRYISK